jgi:hypothetical protein
MGKKRLNGKIYHWQPTYELCQLAGDTIIRKQLIRYLDEDDLNYITGTNQVPIFGATIYAQCKSSLWFTLWIASIDVADQYMNYFNEEIPDNTLIEILGIDMGQLNTTRVAVKDALKRAIKTLKSADHDIVDWIGLVSTDEPSPMAYKATIEKELDIIQHHMDIVKKLINNL